MLNHLGIVNSTRLGRVPRSRSHSKAKRRGWRRLAKGQTLVIFALALPALVGATALGADVAVEYYTWVTLQKAADAAALGGATYLPDNPTQAQTTATALAEANGVQASEITNASAINSNQDMNVQIQRTVPYSFAKVLGLTNAIVKAQATAGPQYAPYTVNAPTPGASSSPSTTPDNNGNTGSYGTTTGANALLPIGLNSTTTYVNGQTVNLNQGQTAPGNWDLLALGGTGGANLRTNLANGYTGMVTVGDWVTTEPGKKVGPVDQGLSDRLALAQTTYPSGTSSSHRLTDPRVLVLPIVSWAGQGRTSVPVTAFATVWLNSVSGGTVNVTFISQVIANTYGSPTAPSTYGAKGAPILIQ